MKMKFLAVAFALGGSAFLFTPTATAQYYGQPHGGYGNGNHDLRPHGHTVQTPFGNYSYYGNGLHDLRAHGHTADPYNGVRSYSNGPFRSTQSYNGFPGGYNSHNSPFGHGGYSSHNSPFGHGGGFGFRHGFGHR